MSVTRSDYRDLGVSDTLRLTDVRLFAAVAIVFLGAVSALAQADRSSVEVDLLKQALDDGATVLLIDVRETHEIASGSIPGAIHVPVGELESRMDDIPKDVRLVFF
jgi:predicted sulfurtransferase